MEKYAIDISECLGLKIKGYVQVIECDGKGDIVNYIYKDSMWII